MVGFEHLLEPAEEEFDLPAVAVQETDEADVDVQQVRQKQERMVGFVSAVGLALGVHAVTAGAARVGHVDLDEAQGPRGHARPGGLPARAHDAVGAHAFALVGLGHGAFLERLEDDVVAHAADEGTADRQNVGHQIESEVATVVDVETAGVQVLAQFLDLARLAVRQRGP